MNLWKVEPLTDRGSIRRRFWFRLLWCAVGGVVSLLLLGFSVTTAGALLGIVPSIAAIGAIVDTQRLKARESGNS